MWWLAFLLNAPNVVDGTSWFSGWVCPPKVVDLAGGQKTDSSAFVGLSFSSLHSRTSAQGAMRRSPRYQQGRFSCGETPGFMLFFSFCEGALGAFKVGNNRSNRHQGFTSHTISSPGLLKLVLCSIYCNRVVGKTRLGCSIYEASSL